MSMADLVSAGAPELPEGWFYRVLRAHIPAYKVQIREQRRFGSRLMAESFVLEERHEDLPEVAGDVEQPLLHRREDARRPRRDHEEEAEPEAEEAEEEEDRHGRRRAVAGESEPPAQPRAQRVLADLVGAGRRELAADAHAAEGGRAPRARDRVDDEHRDGRDDQREQEPDGEGEVVHRLGVTP